MIAQRTLARPAETVGVGLHSGVKVTLRLEPAPPDSGIRFVRIDHHPEVEIPVTADAVSETRLCTGVGRGGVTVGTIEHLLSALAGVGVDNVRILVDGPEVPIMDGSAAPFVLLLLEAGTVAQHAPRRFLRVTQAIEVREGEKWARLEPFDGFRLSFQIAFDHPAIAASKTEATVDFAEESYLQAVARARTFGFVHEVEQLQQMGLARGGSLDNAVVLDEYRVLNAGGLRTGDEFVRHKILDAIGDLYVLGHPLLAHYRAFKSGHALNNRLIRALLADARAWEWVTFTDDPAHGEFLPWPHRRPALLPLPQLRALPLP